MVSLRLLATRYFLRVLHKDEVEQESQAKDGGEGADVAHGTDHAAERAGLGFVHAPHDATGQQRDDGLDEKELVVGSQRIGAAF